MLEPKVRILTTSLAALGVALVVSLVVIGGQKSSGRSDLTERATAFVRLLKGSDADRATVGGASPIDFLRPEDRTNGAALAGLKKLASANRTDDEEIDFSRVDVFDGGRGRTLRARGPEGRPSFGERPIDWIRGADGRWYLDPAGL